MALISTKVSTCFERYEALLRSEGLEEYGVLRSAWQEELGRLRNWSSKFKAHRTGYMSLDYELRDLGSLANHVVDLLDFIGYQLEQAKSHPTGRESDHDDASDDQDEETSSESEDESEEVTKIVTEALREVDEDTRVIFYKYYDKEPSTPMQTYYKNIRSLTRLLTSDMDSALSEPEKTQPFGTLDYLVCHSPRNKYVLRFKDVDERHVAAKFPDAPRDLITRLGLNISRCRANLEYRKRRYNDPGGPNQSKFDIRYKDFPDDEPENVKDPQEDTPELTTSSSSHFETSYNEDLVCGRQPLSFPSRPSGAEPSPCPYCFHLSSFHDDEFWRLHVLTDMRAYVCVFPDCGAGDESYATPYDWCVHINEHSIPYTPENSMQCFLCRETISCNSAGYHFENHLEELAAFALVDPFSQPVKELETKAVMNRQGLGSSAFSRHYRSQSSDIPRPRLELTPPNKPRKRQRRTSSVEPNNALLRSSLSPVIDKRMSDSEFIPFHLRCFTRSYR